MIRWRWACSDAPSYRGPTVFNSNVHRAARTGPARGPGEAGPPVAFVNGNTGPCPDTYKPVGDPAFFVGGLPEALYPPTPARRLWWDDQDVILDGVSPL